MDVRGAVLHVQVVHHERLPVDEVGVGLEGLPAAPPHEVDVSRLLFADPALQRVLRDSLRMIAPAVLFFGLSGGATGLLYTLRRFSYTAVSGAMFNLGIVLAVPLLAPRLHTPVHALSLGVVAGSLLQLAVLLPGMRGVPIRFSTAWRHPASMQFG